MIIHGEMLNPNLNSDFEGQVDGDVRGVWLHRTPSSKRGNL